MNRRRITGVSGAATGGLLGAALLPAAVAFADTYEIVPAPDSVETVTGLYGIVTAPPAVAGTYMGHQLFDVKDTTTGATVGTFEADESNYDYSASFGTADRELLVTHVLSGHVGTASGDVPPVGSVIDTYTVGSGLAGYSNVYTDLASTTPGGDVITDEMVTADGSFSIPVTFDAAKGIAADSLGSSSIPLGSGYDLVPDPSSAEQIDGINGLPPVTVAVQGDQQFDITGPTGATVGSFDALETTSQDTLGNATEELLVTSDVSGTSGTAAGDVPAVGSVFNVINLSDNISNVYSDLASPSGDVVSDTLRTPYGNVPLPFTFDPAPAFVTESFQAPVYLSGFIPDGSFDIAPDSASTEAITGINGLPPLHIAVQGDQLFDVTNTTGNTVGTFDADVTTSLDMFGNYSESLLVTSDVTGTAGASAGDVPPVGSVLEVLNIANTGVENVYSDLVSASGNQISDSLVTPFGDIPVLDFFDAAGGLGDATFLP